MLTFRNLLLLVLAAAGLICFTLSASATPIVFNFDSDTAGTDTFPDPLIEFVGGLGLAVTGATSVCDVSSLSFSSLSGNALITDYCGSQGFGPTILKFSSPLSALTFNYATSEAGTLELFFLDSFSRPVGTITIGDPGGAYEGVGNFSGPGSFDTVFVDFLNAGTPDYALDNLTATLAPVPEPASFALLGTGVLGFAGMVGRRFRR